MENFVGETVLITLGASGVSTVTELPEAFSCLIVLVRRLRLARL